MASSPPYPYPSSLPNPKKRPSLGSQSATEGPTSKRPKLHPLRQTSFPAQDAPGSHASAGGSARSETGSVTNSHVSATSTKVPGRGRGRPRKSAQLHEIDIQVSQAGADTGSQINGSSRNAGRGGKSVVSGKSGPADQDEEEDDDEDLGDVGVSMTEQEAKDAEAQAERDMQRRNRLVKAFTPEQMHRYEMWRATSFPPKVLKKLVNGIVSQSVMPVPLQVLGLFVKYFVGEILERAREVQIEYAQAYEETRTLEKKSREEELRALEEKQKTVKQEDFKRVQTLRKDIERLKKEVEEYMPNPHKGGLLPDHLREALRRYKSDAEGENVGLGGISHGLLGAQGSVASRLGDGVSPRRLFR